MSSLDLPLRRACAAPLLRAHGPLVAITILAASLRLHVATTMGTHLDEPASVLALNRFVDEASVRLPSGVPYLQGFGLTILATPMALAGYGTIGDLTALRLVTVACGTLAVLMTGTLVARISRSRWAGAGAAALLALDPLSIRWSGHFRMYALLQAVSVGLLLLALSGRPTQASSRRIATTTAVACFAVWTHIQAAVLVAPLALLAMVLARSNRAQARRWLPYAVGAIAAGLAPATIVAANRVLGGGRTGTEQHLGPITFVGSNWVRLDGWTAPSWSTWWEVAGGGPAGTLVPLGAVGGSLLLLWAARHHRDPASAVLVGLHWVAVLGITSIQAAPTPRYLLFVLPLTFAIVARSLALVAGGLVPWLPPGPRPAIRRAAFAAAALAAVAGTLASIDATRSMTSESPDLLAAARWIEDLRSPGDQVLVTLPPGPAQVLGREDLAFLSGRPDGERHRLYTLASADGARTDFWMGVPAIASARELCDRLLGPRDAWVVVPERNLRDPHWFALDQQEAIDRLTVEVGQVDAHLRLRRSGESSPADRAWCAALPTPGSPPR